MNEKHTRYVDTSSDKPISKYAIRKDVPLPETNRRGGRGTSVYPFDEMERGDSFQVETPEGKAVVKVRNAVYAAVRKYKSKAPTRTFTTRVISPTTVGVWRIK